MIDYKVDKKVFECPSCNAQFDVKDEALECCAYVFTEEVERFECDKCDNVFDELEEAQDCCEEKCDEPTVRYVCPTCEEEYDSDDYNDPARRAKFCCVKKHPRDGYSCDDCNKVYGSQVEAVQCCHDVEPVTQFACECGASFETKEDAAACCR